MSKQPTANLLDEDLPPPYEFPPASSSAPSIPADTRSSLFAAHLTNLHSQIASERAVRTSVREQRDSQTLALLVPHIEELLSSIAAMHPPPSLVEATMVPDEAVDKAWRFIDSDNKLRGEARRLLRVERDLKLEGDRKPSPRTEAEPEPQVGAFDEWGRWEDKDDTTTPNSDAVLWWSDEAMARRLAKHLQPDRPTARVDRQTVRAHVAQAKEDRKGSRWSLFKKDEPPKPPPPSFASAPRHARDSDEDVTMTVRAEEVTFRKESDLGIWESKTGWGIVVRIRIKKT